MHFKVAKPILVRCIRYYVSLFHAPPSFVNNDHPRLLRSSVIFSCVRAAGSKGIGFLSDVRRMNVALTRAKYFLFVIARCASIVMNPYWRDLVDHAYETEAIIKVPVSSSPQSIFTFSDLSSLQAEKMM